MEKLSNDFYSKLKKLLWQTYESSAERNEHYSVRAFARDLSLDSSTLVKIMSGKRNPSSKNLTLILDHLGLTVTEIEDFTFQYKKINSDVFTIIADWEHFAILDLVLVPGISSDRDLISKKIGMSIHKTNKVIERLLRYGLLIEQKGELKKTNLFLTNQLEGIDTSSAMKEYQRQVLGLGMSAIDSIEQDLKDITSITIATTPKNLAIAREEIKKFRRSLCSRLEDGEKTDVYQLAIQYFPLTKTSTKGM